MKKILSLFVSFWELYHRFMVKYIKAPLFKSRLGYCGKNVELRLNRSPGSLSRIYLYDNTNIYHEFRFISVSGRLVMRKNSGAAAGLTVITGNHQRIKGVFFKDISGSHEYDIEKDVIVEEDVWIGANVILLSGVTVGRGATVAAGSVCVKNVPPYAVVMGNPARVVGFNFAPEEIVEHEKHLYPENERLPLELLEKNYKKYFLDRAIEIKSFIK